MVSVIDAFSAIAAQQLHLRKVLEIQKVGKSF
jgi:hypothetical protein